jgi:ABC-type Na+ transport system ATPase subunit NatA
MGVIGFYKFGWSELSVLIFDEPTSGMDVENRRMLWDLLLVWKGMNNFCISPSIASWNLELFCIKRMM